MLSIGISACSDHDHGPDADHSHATEQQPESNEKVTAPKEDHLHDDNHQHALETEAFYGEDAENAPAPTENEADHQSHDHNAHDYSDHNAHDHNVHDHNESHKEGDHDHHH